jgi:soluble lytic murein transglycosylase-like protein
MKNLRTFASAGIGLLLAAVVGLPAHAALRVQLRTGSSLTCDHRQDLGERVRLYFTTSGDNYVEVAADDILSAETVPDAIQPESASMQKSAASPSQDSRSKTLDLPALLDAAGTAHRLDPDFLASVVKAESGGRPQAVSKAGAQGLMQLMPETAADLGVTDSFAPKQNIDGGTAYLDALLQYYGGNVRLALAAYNAGPAAVDRYGGIPPYPETRRYVARVIHDFNRRKRNEARRHSHETLSAETGSAASEARH